MASVHALECRGVSLSYDSTTVLRGLDLEVRSGETVALLGPSGSGKTSLLGAVAGFVPITAGSILIDGETVAGHGAETPPERRAVSMVFQNYALWPHMTAVDIVAYPLLRGGVAKNEAASEARRLLERVGIGDLERRFPSELSGGQQQRVGLARALAKTPSIYLFDEPTAHLDAALRTVLQEELIDRRRETGAAAVYATHDPQEALAVADRLALLRNGRVVQIGPPQEVYECPVDPWAAQLTGLAGVIDVEVVERREDVLTLRLAGIDLAVAGGGLGTDPRGTAVVRPEWIALGGRLPGRVHRVRYTGPRSVVLLETPVGNVWVDSPVRNTLRPGDETGWSLERVWMVPGA